MAETMIIAVYGTGCKKCKELHKNTLAAANRFPHPTQVDYITDIMQISGAGIMSTPALSINNKVVSQGKVLSESAVCELLFEHCPTQQ